MTHTTYAILRTLAVLIAASFALSLASCSDYPRIYTVKTEVSSNQEVVRTPQLTSVEELRETNNKPGPRVHTKESTHDFGLMDPLTMGSHTFRIRNVGDEPLQVQQGPTTCKCTLSKLSGDSIEPGEEVRVTVKWNSGKDAMYTHSATVFTNDPRQKAVTFTIRGKVRALFRCDPPELVFSRVAPGERATASAVVYSQVWHDFSIENIASTLKGVEWETTKLSGDTLIEADVKSAYRVDVVLPDDLAEGYFNGALRIAGRGAESDQPAATDNLPSIESEDGTHSRNSAHCEVALQGKVLRRLSVYGPTIMTSGVVDMGRLKEGTGKTVKLLLKVRDTDVELKVREVETTPGFLQVRVEPHQSRSKKQLGLYHLYIEVPRDAPPFRLPPDRMAQLKIEFDHPRIGCLELPVDLIIMRKAT
jgi:hypothetical protein